MDLFSKLKGKKEPVLYKLLKVNLLSIFGKLGCFIKANDYPRHIERV
jgi:hypothetical protein